VHCVPTVVLSKQLNFKSAVIRSNRSSCLNLSAVATSHLKIGPHSYFVSSTRLFKTASSLSVMASSNDNSFSKYVDWWQTTYVMTYVHEESFSEGIIRLRLIGISPSKSLACILISSKVSSVILATYILMSHNFTQFLNFISEKHC